MIIVALVLAPLLMLLVSVVEQRLGPSAAGWAAALPVAFVVSTAAVTLHGGADLGAEVAVSAITHVPAQVGFAIVFAGVLWRRGLVVGAIGGVMAYAAAAVVVALVPPAVAFAAGVVAVLGGSLLMPRLPIRPGAQRSWLTTALNCSIASVMVGAVIVASELSGPGVAGMILAFPAMCTAVTVILVVRSGRDAGVHALGGLVRSLPSYLTFGMVVAAVEPVSDMAAIPVALIACLAVGVATWRRVPTATPLIQQALPDLAL